MHAACLERGLVFPCDWFLRKGLGVSLTNWHTATAQQYIRPQHQLEVTQQFGQLDR
jgi:hypothetical protein